MVRHSQGFLLKQSTATLYLLSRERLYLVHEGWSYTKGELCELNLNSFCSVLVEVKAVPNQTKSGLMERMGPECEETNKTD